MIYWGSLGGVLKTEKPHKKSRKTAEKKREKAQNLHNCWQHRRKRRKSGENRKPRETQNPKNRNIFFLKTEKPIQKRAKTAKAQTPKTLIAIRNLSYRYA